MNGAYCEIVDGDRVVGLTAALTRYRAYYLKVVWFFHSEYRGHYIFRAFHPNGKPCALYSIVTDKERLVAVNLSGIKDELKIYLGVLAR